MAYPRWPRSLQVADAADLGGWGHRLLASFESLARRVNITAATNTVTLWVVGIVGVISFLRHAVFHRSDAKRMGWDYGKRNDFQLEVGFANLAWGPLIAWAQNWILQAQGGTAGVWHLHGSLAASTSASQGEQPANMAK